MRLQNPQFLKGMGSILAKVHFLRSLVQKPALNSRLKDPVLPIKFRDHDIFSDVTLSRVPNLRCRILHPFGVFSTVW